AAAATAAIHLARRLFFVPATMSVGPPAFMSQRFADQISVRAPRHDHAHFRGSFSLLRHHFVMVCTGRSAGQG
ncbi:hypothetical protein MVAC_25970, partial [Mycolicibacterium vaccae ATCC 25954]